jgi:hypothetical protein
MRCPRCAGCLITRCIEWPNVSETWCLNCGYRKNDPLPTPYVSPRMMGTNACALCGQMRSKYSTLCRGCAIAEGAAVRRGRG